MMFHLKKEQLSCWWSSLRMSQSDWLVDWRFNEWMNERMNECRRVRNAQTAFISKKYDVWYASRWTNADDGRSGLQDEKYQLTNTEGVRCPPRIRGTPRAQGNVGEEACKCYAETCHVVWNWVRLSHRTASRVQVAYISTRGRAFHLTAKRGRVPSLSGHFLQGRRVQSPIQGGQVDALEIGIDYASDLSEITTLSAFDPLERTAVNVLIITVLAAVHQMKVLTTPARGRWRHRIWA